MGRALLLALLLLPQAGCSPSGVDDDDTTADDDDSLADDDDSANADDDDSANADDDDSANADDDDSTNADDDDSASGDDDDSAVPPPTGSACCYTLQMWDDSGQGWPGPGWEGASLSVVASDPSWNSGPFSVSATSPGGGWWDVQTFCVGQGSSWDLVYSGGANDEDNGFQLFESSGSTASELLRVNSQAWIVSAPAWIPQPFGGSLTAPSPGSQGTFVASCPAPDADPAGTADFDGDGFSTTDGDCDDADPHAFPGQTMWFAIDLGPTNSAGDYDYDCDGVETQQYTATASCPPCASGFIGQVPPCGASLLDGSWSDFCQSTQPGCFPDFTDYALQGCR